MWATEREAMRCKKEAGAPRPWTDDDILGAYRFCNVRREDDRVTRWISTHWREPHLEDPDLWFAMCVARFVNWPDTLEELGWPVPWDYTRFLQIMRNRRQAGEKLYGGAYMIRAASGEPGLDKPSYQVRDVFNVLWWARERLRPEEGDTLCAYHTLLGQFHGLGSFMAAQVVADAKYAPPLVTAPDWWTFAASGPGSRRGLNRVLGRPVNSPWQEEDWRLALHEMPVRGLCHGVLGRLHAQDLQNCLCEWDKYERTRLGEGRPRARYP